MSLETHVEALNIKHAKIEEIIIEEELRPCPDRMRLIDLKKQKLRIKEAMSRLENTRH